MSEFNVSIEPDVKTAIVLGLAATFHLDLTQESAINDALAATGADLISLLQENTSSYFKNPSGRLAGSFRELLSIAQVEVISELPYARRRELGLNGQDSLGRKYKDVGAHYMADDIATISDTIPGRFTVAFDRVFSRMMTGS